MNGTTCLFAALLLGASLAGCTAAGPFTDDLFEQHDVVIGSAERQTVLSGFLLGGAVAELAVVHIDEHDDRRLRVYSFGDGTWAPRLDATLRREVSFVDVANIDGRDRLVTYGGGNLNWFDPESASERPLVAVTSDFSPPPGGAILHVDVTRDVNGDDRDDLVVPDSHGFRVFIQMEGGAFADPVKLGPSTGMPRIYGADGYRYDPWVPGRLHEMDYDRDGRGDLAFWNEDHFEVHHQDEHGLFAEAATTFTTDVIFDSDELASLAAPQGVRSRRKDHMPPGDLTGRVLHRLTDMNGDGVADLVVFSLEGGSLWSMHSTYEVHFGTPSPGGTEFAPDISTAIRSDGICFGMEQHDFDRDGQADMMLTIIDPDLLKVIGMLIDAFLTHSVSLDLEFYRMKDGIYPAKPNTTRQARSDTPRKGEDRSSFPAVLIGDVNGDHRSDLLVGRSRREMRVFLGVPGPDLFARRPQRVSVAMPRDEEHTWLVDLNRDGKQDILMHHPSTTEPHRVTMLIAR
ncbi:MAG: VCBS repeat-containing protein [bacterium]|nr:VCBS repeat-containing protein [bacterium]